MSEVERIQDQLIRAFQGEAWHGPSVKETLAGVTAAKAIAKPLANTHCIWEIVLHITAWQEAVRRRLQGETIELTEQQDWPPVRETTEVAWSGALTALESAHSHLLTALSHLTDEQLAQKAAGSNYSNYFMLHGVIQHNLFHAGQIAVLKKG